MFTRTYTEPNVISADQWYVYIHVYTVNSLYIYIVIYIHFMEELNQRKVELGHWTYKSKNEMDIIKLGKTHLKAQNSAMTRRMSVSLSNLNRDCL